MSCHLLQTALRTLGMVCLCAPLLLAQTNRGGIAGTIFDPTGAVIPGAIVKVTNIGTNHTVTLTASAEGRYSADLLEPVNYRITVEAPGFRTAVVEPVKVDTSSVLTANVTLQPRGVATEVTVTAEAAILNAESGTVSQTVSERQITDIPLAERSVLNLVQTVPNVSGDVLSETPDIGTGTLSPGAGISVNGGRPGSGGFLADGANNTAPGIGRTVVDTAVIAAFRQQDPQIAHFQTILRARADDEYDTLVVLGSTRSVSDSWCNKGDLLGLFLQDRDHPDRVYKLTLQRESAGGFRIQVLRYRPGELTLARLPEYGGGALNLKFFFDVRSKTITREMQYRPFSVASVIDDQGEPYFIAEDGKQFLAIHPADGRFEVLRGAAATRVLAHVPVSESSTPQQRFRNVDRRGTEPAKFGPQSRFSLHFETNPSWGPLATGVEERNAGTTRTYPLKRTSCADFQRRRTKEYNLNGCPQEVFEEIGPHQVFEDRLWFAESFYDAEGSGGVGAFGYFDPIEHRYNLFSPPEIADWSGSALLIETEAAWIALAHRGEYGDTPGGLLRWDRATHKVARYDAGAIINRIVRYRDRLYLATADGIDVLRDGTVEKFIVDQTSRGAYVVLAR